jgi:hypothetical protein
MAQLIQILHRPSQTVLAEGKRGWDITPFEGNYYVRKKCLIGNRFKLTLLPGFCVYKFVYLWMNLQLDGQAPISLLAWKYVIPNPLFPFIWYRVGIYGGHPEIEVREFD